MVYNNGVNKIQKGRETMANEMQVFTNEQFGQVRTITEDGKTIFCGFDVASALEYAKPRNAIAAHCKGALKRGVLTNGGLQEMTFITEGDVYRLITHSKMPAAERFESWVFDEVIPSIRKTGGYIMGEENMTDDEIMASALLVANRKLEERAARIKSLENKIAIDAPKVDFADALLVCDNCSYIEELAKQLCQIGMKTGRNRLIAEMADDGFLCVRNGVKNMPTQKCVEAGWLVIERKPHIEGERSVMGYTTKVTPSGMQHFIRYYMRKHGLMPLLTTSRTRQSRYNNIATANVCGYENKKKYNLR